MEHGWYQVGFDTDLSQGVAPAEIGTGRLVLVDTPKGIKAFPAACPHRGNDLGRTHAPVSDSSLICPFHGYRIGLDRSGDHGLSLRSVPTLTVGGLVFASPAGTPNSALKECLDGLDQTHYFINGFAMHIDVEASWVIENAFDSAHFRAVHQVRNSAKVVASFGPHGELVGDGEFVIPESPWQTGLSGGREAVAYQARAFSPHVVVSRMGGPRPYVVITSSTPSAGRGTTVRLSLAVPTGPDGQPPGAEGCRYLLRQSRAGLEQDRVIWEALSGSADPQFTPLDTAVQAFHEFAGRFRAPVAQ